MPAHFIMRIARDLEAIINRRVISLELQYSFYFKKLRVAVKRMVIDYGDLRQRIRATREKD